jgi:hypothetical protein
MTYDHTWLVAPRKDAKERMFVGKEPFHQRDVRLDALLAAFHDDVDGIASVSRP